MIQIDKKKYQKNGILHSPITPSIATPHLLHQSQVSLRQFGFFLLRCVHLQCLHDRATVEEVPGEWRCIAQCLQRCIHVARVGEVLQSNETTKLSPIVADRAVIKLICRSSHRFVVVESAGTCQSHSVRVGGQEDLRFTQVTPQPVRGHVDVHGVRSIRPKVQRIVVVHILRAADLKTILVQAHPEIRTDGIAFVALRLLKEREKRKSRNCER